MFFLQSFQEHLSQVEPDSEVPTEDIHVSNEELVEEEERHGGQEGHGGEEGGGGEEGDGGEGEEREGEERDGGEHIQSKSNEGAAEEEEGIEHVEVEIILLKNTRCPCLHNIYTHLCT